MSLVINHNLMATRTANALNAQYGRLATSTQRLSTGLRVNSAADDAAGLAIRELQRADISTLHQGARNANDAVSMIQTADGALAVIDEKLIRMKELAEQAATGTYDSTQRLMIASEFEQMASEIDRIANATDFNGIHLLDGSLSGQHDGKGLTSTGSLKVHFGSGNDSAEDYYYININAATMDGLGLTDPVPPHVQNISEKLENGAGLKDFPSGVVSFAIIPKGTKNIKLHLYDHGANDTIQIFTKSGEHIVGTDIANNTDWNTAGVTSIDDMYNKVLVKTNGFDENAVYSEAMLNGGQAITYIKNPPYNEFNVHGMTISYSGDGNAQRELDEYLVIDDVTEDLIVFSVGSGVFSMQGEWDYMPEDNYTEQDTVYISIKTQEMAQKALNRIGDAIARKDNIRAHLGAMQNRLENTITNLTTQAENLQASESRISDTDIATEMTEFVRNQILTQSAVAMLSQANSLPQMAMQLIGG